MTEKCGLISILFLDRELPVSQDSIDIHDGGLVPQRFYTVIHAWDGVRIS